MDVAPHQRKRDAAATEPALDGEHHRASHRSAKGIGGLAHRPALHRLAVHLHKPVAGLNPGAVGWRCRPWSDDRHPSITGVHREPNAPVTPARHFAQATQAVGREIHTVGIAELVDHAQCGKPIQLIGADRIHPVLLNPLHHAIEQALPLRHGHARSGARRRVPASHHQPAPEREGEQRSRSDRQAAPRHATAPSEWRNSGNRAPMASITCPSTSSSPAPASIETIGPHSSCADCHSSVANSAKARSTRA